LVHRFHERGRQRHGSSRPDIRGRIAGALDRLSIDPRNGSLRKLTGRPERCLRVGGWRVLVELDDETHTIRIARILPRGRAYER
jgi:mRNA-degrading endonuclease RelE of RelBE toxin-antitoxin system